MKTIIKRIEKKKTRVVEASTQKSKSINRKKWHSIEITRDDYWEAASGCYTVVVCN